MTNRERVVEILDALSNLADNDIHPVDPKNWHVYSELCDLINKAGASAVILPKEQEPLAVCEGKVNKCVCGNEINRYWNPEYCGFCGKKLLWY